MNNQDYSAVLEKTSPRASKAREILHSSGSNEWYTPAPYIAAVRRVLGQIDLDPASCEQANQTVQAAQYFTEQDDGLKQEWHGKVFCNPPYGGMQALFASKLIAEYNAGRVTHAILLVNAATDCLWFDPLWDHYLCFPRGRIKFISPTKTKAKQPTHGSAFVYFGLGQGILDFAREFKRYGAIVGRVLAR